MAVIGCGGLGGYAIEMLARAGVGHIRVCDGDVFDETNLNRQLLCTEDVLGKSKAEAAADRIKSVKSGHFYFCITVISPTNNTFLHDFDESNRSLLTDFD